MRFYNPLVLWSLFLLLIPLVIYLFNFRQYKKVYFSNTAFMQELLSQTRKQSRLKHLLILLSRLAFVAALVLAFAGPYLPLAHKQQNKEPKVLIWLDNSFSMQAGGVRGQLFEQGRLLAATIAKAYPPGTRFMLRLNDMMEDVDFVPSDDLMNDLRQARISGQPADFSSLLKAMASDKAAELPDEIYAITDLQQSAFHWEDMASDTLVPVHIIPLPASETKRLFFDTCYIKAPLIRRGLPVDLHFVLRSTAPQQDEQIGVSLTVNGKKKGALVIDVDEEFNSGHLSFMPDSSAFQLGQLTINNAGPAFDKDCYFSFKVAQKLPVLVLGSKQKNNFISDFYAHDSTFSLFDIPAQGVDYSHFKGAALIILNEPRDFSSGLLRELKKYVEGGGRLVYVPADDINTERLNLFNRYFALPAFGPPDTSLLRLREIDKQSPLFADVFTQKDNRMSAQADLPFFKLHYPMSFSTSGSYHHLMLLDNEHALLTRFKLGAGNLYCFSAPLNTRKSNLGKQALMVPLFYKLAVLNDAQKAIYYPVDQQRINLHLPQPSNDEALQIAAQNKAFSFIPRLTPSDNGLVLDLYGNITEAGHYLLKSGAKVLAPLSFNYNKAESISKYYSISQLKKLIDKHQLVNIDIMSSDIKTIMLDINELNKDKPLWKLFVILALMFLVIEVFLLRFLK